MSYENRILIAKKALKELRDIPEKDRELIKDRISKLAFFPIVRLDVKKLKGLEKTYRLRVGEYRVIFEFEKDEKVIKILKICKRSEVYG